MKKSKKHSRVKFLCAVLLCALLGGSLSACQVHESDEAENPKYVIGVVTKSRSSEYWMSVCSGMEKAASDLGVKVIIMSPDTETDEKTQQQMIGSLLKKDIDALAVSPINSHNAKGYLKKAEEKGIQVVSYDTKILEKGVPYIGIDNEKVGRELAQYMAAQMKKKGLVGIISGNLKQSSHASRLKGFRDYIDKNTDIKIAYRKRIQQSADAGERDFKAYERTSGFKRNFCYERRDRTRNHGVPWRPAGADCHSGCPGGCAGCGQEGENRGFGLSAGL